jgi:hypothetical protein
MALKRSKLSEVAMGEMNPLLNSPCRYLGKISDREKVKAAIADLSVVEEAVEFMNSHFPRPRFFLFTDGPCDLEQDELYFLPSADLPGVYLFFDSNGKILYIGKASNKQYLAHRLKLYLILKGDRKGFICRSDSRLQHLFRFVITIPVPRDQAFEAAAIEEYLIGRLQPPLNRIGNPGRYV